MQANSAIMAWFAKYRSGKPGVLHRAAGPTEVFTAQAEDPSVDDSAVVKVEDSTSVYNPYTSAHTTSKSKRLE